MKKIENFVLPAHHNELYAKEAVSSISLSREVAEKINELVDAYNEFYGVDLTWKQEQEGRIRKGIIYMKDNLINTINELLNLEGYKMIDEAVKENIESLKTDLFNNNVDMEAIKKRLDSIISGVTSDSEIIDLRVGADGVNYKTAGAAVREQFGKINGITGEMFGEVQNVVFYQGSIQSDGSVAETTMTIHSDFIPYEEELLLVNFYDGLIAQYFLYDAQKNIITNTAETLNRATGAFRIKHRYNNLESEAKYIRLNLKHDYEQAISPEDATGFVMLKLHEKNHTFADHNFIYDSLCKLKLNKLNLRGAGVSSAGVESPSLLRQSTAEPIDCGVNANVFIKCNNNYQVRGYYYDADGNFVENVDGGLVDGGVAIVAKYPKIKLVFSRKDNGAIDSAEVMANYEVYIEKPNYGESLNNYNVANARLISEADDKMAHCSSVVVDGNKMYVGYYSDKTNNVEAITQPGVKLMLCDTDIYGDKKTVVEMCKLGDVYEGLKQVTYAPYDPTMWIYNGGVRMYFSACDEADGVLLGFLNYPKNGVFTRTKIEYNGVTYQMNFAGMSALYTALGFADFAEFRLIHLSDFIEYNGEYYTTLCMDNRNKALLLKTADGVTFTLIDVLRDADNHREINGVIRAGVFYYIYRGFNGVFFSSYNIETGEKGEELYMVNASSKPMAFSTYFNDYFLLNTNGQRRSVCLYRVEDGKPVPLHGFYNTHSFHYGSCCYKNDYCYISFTSDDGNQSTNGDRGCIKLLKMYIL